MADPVVPRGPEAGDKIAKTANQSAKNIKEAAKGWGATTVQPTAASAKNPPVYMGTTNAPGPVGMGMVLNTPTLDEVTQSYYSWDQKQKDKFLSQLSLAGYDTNGMKDAQAAQLWGAYAGQAAKYFNGGDGQRFTPWDILAMDRRKREAYLSTPRTETATSTSVDLSTNADARAIFLQAAQSLLGRDPTKAETKVFQSALNAQERANPTVTTTTQNFIGDTLQDQQSTTTGGMGAEAKTILAMDDIKKDPEYGAFQAATNGMNWLMEAVNGG